LTIDHFRNSKAIDLYGKRTTTTARTPTTEEVVAVRRDVVRGIK